MDLTLGQLLRTVREANHLSREKAAERVGKSTVWIGELEKDREVPALDLLLRLHEKLVSAGSTNSDLALWLLKWLEATAQDELNTKAEPPDSSYKPGRDNREAALAAIRQLSAASARRKVGPINTSHPPTLRDFPDGFSDLLVVCGDRREFPPKNRGDFFVDSFSSADLASVNLLFDKTGPLEIRSDKYFALGNPGNHEFLKQEYGSRNLIVIGSPAVNLLARTINKYCVFRFQHSKTVRQFLEYWEKGIPEVNDRRLRTIFWDMASHFKGGSQSEIDTHYYYEKYKNAGFDIPEEQIIELALKVKELLKDLSAKYIKNLFHKSGFLDPVDVKLQGFFLRDDNDFGVISICPNPYAEEGSNYFCILAAGIHAPGTYMAIKVLGTNDFQTHPLGGVIEVKLDLDARWIERFPDADFSWQTSNYQVEDLIPILSHPEKFRLFEKCDLADLKALLQFVKRFSNPIVSKAVG